MDQAPTRQQGSKPDSRPPAQPALRHRTKGAAPTRNPQPDWSPHPQLPPATLPNLQPVPAIVVYAPEPPCFLANASIWLRPLAQSHRNQTATAYGPMDDDHGHADLAVQRAEQLRRTGGPVRSAPLPNGDPAVARSRTVRASSGSNLCFITPVPGGPNRPGVCLATSLLRGRTIGHCGQRQAEPVRRPRSGDSGAMAWTTLWRFGSVGSPVPTSRNCRIPCSAARWRAM
jgi:hypothetical protein